MKNVETCGFLFGTEISSKEITSTANSFDISSPTTYYSITHLYIPSQAGTADTCNPLDETEIFEFHGKYPNLVQLGWIHTHPSQTAFLSSVDMCMSTTAFGF